MGSSKKKSFYPERTSVMKFAFVILHYNVLEETEKCIEAIRKNVRTADKVIIVVDNGSPNHTGIEIEKKYSSDDDVVVLKNKENLGFAKGNNIGFIYAKNNLSPEYIVMLNSDVYILGSDFEEKVDNELKKSGFAVLGPMVETPTGNCNSNPFGDGVFSKEKIQSTIDYCKKKIFLCKTGLVGIYDFIIEAKQNRAKKVLEESDIYRNRKEYIPLHGCCWIFSRNYIDIFDGLDDRTFLYGEEDILYLHCKAKNMNMVYNPEIKVFHNEHASTQKMRMSRKRQKFFYENLLVSSEVLMDIYKKEIENRE